MKSLHSFRIGALAAAMAWAVPALHAADASAPSTRFIGMNPVAVQKVDRFIITYKNGSTERASKDATLQSVQAAISRAGLDRAATSSTGNTATPLSVSYQRKLAVGSELVRTSRKLDQGEAQALMAQLAADPAVANVQPDYRKYAVQDFASPPSLHAKTTTAKTQAFAPNDPDYPSYQWHFFNPIGGANVNNAWDVADGTGATVAVLDTGITQHPDLDSSLASANVGYDFISDAFVSGRATDNRVAGGWDLGDWDNTQPYLQECLGSNNPGDGEPSSWHGTVVSGEIAELTNNSLGMAGIAYHAKLLPVRVLGHCGGYDSDISDAIEWASGGHVDGVPDLKQPAQVINMSLGGPGQCTASTPEYTAIQHALARGTTVVVAAGNSGADAANFTPASCPGVIVVAANGITGKRAFYSNYGKSVTISAPGGGIYPNDGSSGAPEATGFIWQAINQGTTTPSYPADAATAYGGMAGTSQAAPHVAGIVALMVGALKAANLPVLSPAQISAMLVKSARAFPVNQDQPIGAGIVDADAAVKLALGGDSGGGDEPAIALSKGQLLSAQSAADGSLLYSIAVPAGATTLNLRTLGGSGNVAMYVKVGAAPGGNGGDADFSSAKPGTSQAVVIRKPQAAIYYIRAAAAQGGFSHISVLADYNP